MAEKVGDVYVTVHADNSRLKNEIKAGAAKDAKSYASEFDKTLSDEFTKIAHKNRQKLAEAFASGDFSKFEKEMGSVEGAVRKVDDEVNHLISSNKITLKQAREIKKAVREWSIPKGLANDVHRVAVNVEKAHSEALGMERAMRRSGQTIPTAMGDIHRAALRMNRQFDIAHARAKKFGTEVKVAGEKGVSGFRRMIPVIDKVTKGVGKVFGQGSRNNFLNIVGSVIGGLTTLFTTPMKAIPAVVDGVSNIADGFGEMAKNIGQAERNMSGLVAAFGQMVLSNINPAGIGILVAAVVAIAATIGVATAAIGAALALAAAAVSVLAGMLLSLASAAAFAIAGGLLPLGPVLLALAPAFGLLIGLMQDFNKTAKEQPKWVKSIKKAWDDSTATISKAKESVGTALAGFFPILTGIWNPLVKSTADAMGGIIKNLGDILKSPGMKGFIAAFQTSLPKIFKSLGLGMNQVLAGLTAFFVPILPYAERLATAFGNIATKFNKWASSKEGQDAISGFMEKAWHAATTLWDIIVQLAGAIGKLFGAGQENGQGFLDWFDGLVTKFNNWLGTTDGQTALKQFFDDAKESAGHLWDLVKELFSLFDSLDTSTSRAQLNLVIDTVTAVAGSFGSILVAAIAIAQPLSLLFRGLALMIAGAFALMVNALAISFGWIPGGIGAHLVEAAGKATKFVGTVNSDFDKIDASFKVTAETADALSKIGMVQTSLGLLPRSKTITINTYYATHGSPPAASGKGGNVTAGASGMMLTGPTNLLAGEAGPEALVPLNRPLALVDPAVRALSAIAQGKTSMASGGVVGASKSITVAPGAIVVNTTQANPRGVALSVLDRLTAAAV